MTSKPTSPKVTNDPRFRAGRTLVQGGKPSDAIPIFAALVEEAIRQFGPEDIETAPVYYEYGNALFRSICRRCAEVEAVETVEEEEKEEKEGGKGATASSSSSEETVNNTGEVVKKEEDVSLAIELMENAWAIVDEYNNEKSTSSSSSTSTTTKAKDLNCKPKANETNKNKESSKENETKNEKMTNNNDDNDYTKWAMTQQPRIMIGIGDVQSFRNQHANAVEAYTKALPHREQAVQYILQMNASSPLHTSVELLTCRRQLVENYVLVAEELLACADGEDVVTTESKVVLVKDDERVDYARGYYHKARDELQETVLLMGKLASQDIGEEKEDICYISTILMHVGELLAKYDEDQEMKKSSESVTKKQKLV